MVKTSHLLLLLWVGVGAVGCWDVHRRVSGAVPRILFFAFWTVLCFLPVAWFEGRGMYWWCVAPRIGEPLADTESRLGMAIGFGAEAVAISYSPPPWWIIPVFGQVVIWPDRDGRVESWTVSWR